MEKKCYNKGKRIQISYIVKSYLKNVIFEIIRKKCLIESSMDRIERKGIGESRLNVSFSLTSL